jgi:hypothetical protein
VGRRKTAKVTAKQLNLEDYSIIVPDSKSQNIPEVVIVRRWAVGVLGIGEGGTVG